MERTKMTEAETKKATPRTSLALGRLKLDEEQCWSLSESKYMKIYLTTNNNNQFYEYFSSKYSPLMLVGYNKNKDDDYGELVLTLKGHQDKTIKLTAAVFKTSSQSDSSHPPTVMVVPDNLKNNEGAFEDLRTTLSFNTENSGRMCRPTDSCKEEVYKPNIKKKRKYMCLFLSNIHFSDFKVTSNNKNVIVKKITADIKAGDSESSGSEQSANRPSDNPEQSLVDRSEPGATPRGAAPARPKALLGTQPLQPNIQNGNRMERSLTEQKPKRGSVITSKILKDEDTKLIKKLFDDLGQPGRNINLEEFRRSVQKYKAPVPAMPLPTLTKLSVEWLPESAETVETILCRGSMPPSLQDAFDLLPDDTKKKVTSSSNEIDDEQELIALVSSISMDTRWLSTVTP
jgi:hypothetical protein